VETGWLSRRACATIDGKANYYTAIPWGVGGCVFRLH
jgi:hypothetical protein